MTGLPAGWINTRIDHITDINPRHARILDDSLVVTFVRMPALSETSWRFESTEERPLGTVRKGFTHFAEGDVLFAKITPCMENGKAAVAVDLVNGIGCGTTELHVMRPLCGIDSKYLFHFVHQESFREEAARNFTGTAGQLRVPVYFVKNTEIPLPPLKEQHRIVAKMEMLLKHVDAAQERLATIPRILKRFRQSVLTAACSGRLTVDWRAQTNSREATSDLLRRLTTEREKKATLVNGKRRNAPSILDVNNLPELPTSWQWVTLDQIVEEGRPIIYGIIKPGPHDPNGVPYVRVMEMKDGTIAPVNELKRASRERASKFKRATLKAGDLLISKDGTIGRVAIVPPELDGGNITQHLVRASIHPYLNREFIAITIASQHSQSWLVGEKKGVALQGVNVEDFRRLPLPIAPLDEQQEIVRRVEALFKTANVLEARYFNAKAHVNKLTQSILAKAFRGELVPQDPRDEPASVLLERVRQQRNGSSGPKVPSSTKRSRR
jgi:type I restriction enzyme, S subunit